MFFGKYYLLIHYGIWLSLRFTCWIIYYDIITNSDANNLKQMDETEVIEMREDKTLMNNEGVNTLGSHF